MYIRLYMLSGIGGRRAANAFFPSCYGLKSESVVEILTINDIADG